MFLLAALGGPAVHAASVAHGPMRGWTPAQYVNDMLVGWNLGNTMDANPNETGWGNPTTTQAMIDAVHSKGFKFMRLPVTWKGHFGGGPNYTIDQAWLSRVVTIANYAFNDSIYVMVNIHHDGTTGGWFPLNASGSQATAIAGQVAAIWTQIANAFKDYGDYMVFEIFNEPQDGAPNMYGGGDDQSRTNLAAYQTAAVNAIRATGGNNATRMIVLQGISASPLAVSVATIPMVDANTIVSLHTYDPVPYSMNCSPNTWGSAADSASILSNLKSEQNMVAGKHGTAIIGEWGSENCDDQDSRAKHAYFYARQCRLHAMLPVWWDDGANFHLLNRKANPPSWDYPNVVQAIVDGAKAGAFPIGILPRPGEGRFSWNNDLKVEAGVVHYALPAASQVSLRLLNIQGEVVANLAQSHQAAGNHEVKLSREGVAPGHYLLELKAGSKRVSKNIVTF
ncbi:MAG: glycoside hydrolase family 5 protein [Fibrobacteres bacterium]|nr:glycoside hydrolase family 5 protein [Fibrobacterota bacterium]